MPSTPEDRLFGITTSVAVKPAVAISADYNVITYGEQIITSSTMTGDRTITTTQGMRVLLINQDDKKENGIWLAGPVTWQRAPDFDGARDVVNGTLVFSVYGDCWQVEGADPIHIDYDEITFRSTYPFSGDLNAYQRTIRVPDAFVSPLPPLSQLEGKIIAFSDGKPIGVLPESGSAADVMIQLAGDYGFSFIGGTQIFRLTLAQAKAYTQYAIGQRVFITDIGYHFKFSSERNIIPGQIESAISNDDELHKLVTSGGMLEFDDYDKLSALESQNYALYQARLRANQPIGMVSYGDSITYGYRPDGGQYANNYPALIAQILTSNTKSVFTNQNKGFPSDRALTNYVRNINDGTSGNISTIMLGVNDALYSTDNGNNPAGMVGDSLYGTKNYALVMRKFVARELLRGRCVVLLGTTQFASQAGEIGILTATYLSRAYDAIAKQVAAEFGCGFVDTKRDATQQFGISESTHDGIHLNSGFLEIIARRFSAFFLNQDYKNPCVLRPGSVFIPNVIHNPISSNRTLNLETFNNGSSPPLLGGASDPMSTGVRLPNDENGGVVVMGFYLDADSTVIYPSVNSDGSNYSFNLILDNGATQPDYPSDVDVLLRDRQYIYSGKSISGSGKKNITTENYSQITAACYMHITTRGWHTLSFSVGPNSGVAVIEGLVCESWESIRNNHVFGGISGALYRNSGGNEISGVVTGCIRAAAGVYDVSTNNLAASRYRVDIQCKEDELPIVKQVIYQTQNSFRVLFFNLSGAPVDPTSFNATVIGGR